MMVAHPFWVRENSSTSSEMPSILVFVPCYNCAEFVSGVLKSIPDGSLKSIAQVLVVDNGSKDATLENAVETARSLMPGKFTVVRNEENYGLGGSHKVALDFARSNGIEFVATLHGDGQADARELANLISVLESNPDAHAVLGCRFMPGSRIIGYSRTRTLGNLALNLAYTVLSGHRVYDLGSGLNIMATNAPLNFESFADDCTFNQDLVLALLWANCRVVQTPISWAEQGQRSNVNAMRIGIQAFGNLLHWRIRGCPRGHSKHHSLPRQYRVHFP